jgi:hypothetical protein
MKNLTFFVVALFMATNLSAQKGVKIGLHFTPGASMGLNSEDFDKGETLNLDGTFGWDLGLTVGYGFNDKLALVTGIGFNSHTAAFVHDRVTIYDGTLFASADPNLKAKFSRSLGYIRIPLYLQIGGSSAEEGGGFFFRFGPTFNFLTSAKYEDARFEIFSGYDKTTGIDVNKQTDLWTSNDGGVSRTKTTDASSPSGFQQGSIYQSFVLGVGLDIGGQIKLAENFHMIITLHLETSLTNPEGIGASSYAHNISNDVVQTAGDLLNVGLQNTPFDATYPNYIAEAKDDISTRESTFNVFGGLTFGFQYTIAVD